jgi:paxillin
LAAADPLVNEIEEKSEVVEDNDKTEYETGFSAPFVRDISAHSHRRTGSWTSIGEDEQSNSGRPLARPPRPSWMIRNSSVPSRETTRSPSPSLAYRESGQRYMERMEAQSIRQAMEDLDFQEEQKLFDAAQDEAAELVWKHQNPNAPYPYKERRRSTNRVSSGSYSELPSNLPARTSSSERKSSGSRVPSDTRDQETGSQQGFYHDPVAPGLQNSSKENASSLPSGFVATHVVPIKQRRTSSGSRRKLSGSIFANPEDKIYEEPEEEETQSQRVSAVPSATPMPLQVRRNPFARVKLGGGLPRANTDPLLATNKFDKYEIHKNPPTQSRNACYTTNLAPLSSESNSVNRNVNSSDTAESSASAENGLEKRSDDIRAATSAKLKDRSPKLPTPTMVSDNPGRPIVSFQKNWKPREIELKGEMSTPSEPGIPVKTKIAPYVTKSVSSPNVPTLSQEEGGNQIKTAPPVINLPDAEGRPRRQEEDRKRSIAPTLSTGAVAAAGRQEAAFLNNKSSPMPVPSINVHDTSAPAIPVISVSDNSTSPRSHSSNVPSFNVQSVPQINVDAPPIPTISFSCDDGSKPSTRPLPNPKTSSSSRPVPRKSLPSTTSRRSPWTTSTVRGGALCAQCGLPIAGRIVSAAGSRFHPECFTCHHCNEALECVAFYPEPDAKHAERIQRIERRRKGEILEEIRGQTEEDDGDESIRFYCHLDYHEFFSPRCKSCKTPIEGEVIVACGAEWHAGHFFCAQCGDPFDAKTPFIEKDGYAWCVNCHTNRYSTKCRKCRKPVTDTVVKALGQEWHEQCFSCMVGI